MCHLRQLASAALAVRKRIGGAALEGVQETARRLGGFGTSTRAREGSRPSGGTWRWVNECI